MLIKVKKRVLLSPQMAGYAFYRKMKEKMRNMKGDKLKYMSDVVRRLLWGEVTEEEREQWMREVEEAHCGEVLERLSDEGYVDRRLAGYKAWDEKEAFRRFVEEVERIKKRRQLRRRMAWSAVAAGVACLVGVALLLVPERQVELPVVEVRNEVVVPGSTKATLRLAGGETVDIRGDSMQITRKGKSHILYAGGKLTYAKKEKVAELVYNELEVPVAGECSLVLDDGTQVWVNADSRLKYPVQFVGEERKVFLEGEAYFIVAKDSLPFVVSTSRGDIRVLGTTFNVKSYDEEVAMQATLVEGKVLVAQGQKEMELAPGEQGTVTDAGIMAKRAVDVDEFVGWRKGIYVFKKQPLEDIMRDLSRWYGVSVFFQNEGLKQVSFTGNLKRYDNINEFLDVLQRTGDVKYRINNNTVIIYE